MMKKKNELRFLIPFVRTSILLPQNNNSNCGGGGD
jgi:hypothetical protein